MAVTDHPYAHFLRKVRKPSQYLGGEHGQRLTNWAQASCRMCLAFPDLYEIGMSHLGYKILYGLINEQPDLIAERAYAPWPDMEEQLRLHEVKLRSLESARPLCDFDIVGFSLQFELTYTNILLMLELGGIPRWSHEREQDDPLIVAGGPTATHPEPIAPFVDVFLIGDGEEKTPELMRCWSESRRQKLSRRQALERIAALGGFYVPSLYATAPDPGTGLEVVDSALSNAASLPIERAFVPDLKDYPFPHDGPVATTETTFDRVSVEIARGCTEGCRFCQAGMIYRPVRERPPEQVVDTIVSAVEQGGYDEASLTSLSTADYSAISPLVHETVSSLASKNVGLSVSSLRAYGLGEDVLDSMKQGRAGGLTFAPEAGTQRMRDVVNKNVTDAQLMETAERIFSRGWSKMKLYFMIGLPTEQDDDVLGIVETGQRAWEVGKKALEQGRPRVTVSVSTHVPKPHTPFQWCAMDGREEIKRKQALLKNAARTSRVQLRMHDCAGSWLEGVLARGDRRLARVISAAYDAGARFDSWDEHLKLDVWEEAFASEEIDLAPFLRTLPTTARLPWSHIDVGLEDGFLEREYRKALRNRLSPPCGKAAGMFVHHDNAQDAQEDARRLVCYDCGIACDLSQMREERLVFLRSLGAEAPPTVTPPEERQRVDRRPMQHVKQGEALRVRLRYQKLGKVAFNSHLDLVRLLPRIFRRAELPLFYSRGFHPLPEMSFGPALAVGIASLCEYVDIKLRRDVPVDIESLSTRLNQATFEGLGFTGSTALGPQDAGINKVIKAASYVLGLPQSALEALGDPSKKQLQQDLALRCSEPLRVRRETEGIARIIDLGTYLQGVSVEQGGDSLRRAGVRGNLLPIRVEVAITGQGSARPEEILRGLFGDVGQQTVVIRESLGARREGGEWVDPLLAPTLRAARTTQVSPECSAAIG